MKIIIDILLLLFLFDYSLFADNADDGILSGRSQRLTKSYSNEKLSAEEYYKAGSEGKLVREGRRKEPFLSSSLQQIGGKFGGIRPGATYKDLSGETWFVKEGQAPLKEYIGSRVMNLLVGPYSPEVELIADKPGYTASRFISGFVPGTFVHRTERAKYKNKPLVGQAELDVAMDLMGLGDRHPGNQGYIDMGDRLEAARVDFDEAFKFDDFEMQELKFSNADAVESIVNIPDEMILYVLGDAFQDIWDSGILEDKKFKGYTAEALSGNLGPTLIARKHELKNILLELREYEALYNKAKNDPSLYTAEDYERMTQLIIKLWHPDSLLFWAVESGEPNIVYLLLDKGVDVNQEDENWRGTPLHKAVEKNNIDMVRFLLDKGADIDHVDKMGRTAFDRAMQEGHVDIARLLLDNGVNVNHKDDTGCTSICYAARFSSPEFVLMLLEKGADVNIRNGDGKTALDIAKEKGRPDIINLLEEWQKNVESEKVSYGSGGTKRR